MIDTKGKKQCEKCKEWKTYPCFPFNGTGKKKKGKAGQYRGGTCLSCGGKKK